MEPVDGDSLIVMDYIDKIVASPKESEPKSEEEAGLRLLRDTDLGSGDGKKSVAEQIMEASRNMMNFPTQSMTSQMFVHPSTLAELEEYLGSND